MPARKPAPPGEKPQRERFIETAREIGASEKLADFERAFRQVVHPPKVPAARISTGDRAQDVALVAPQWERGRAGAAARARKLSPERRVEIARKAAAARWPK
jgi:hypothetical protein